MMLIGTDEGIYRWIEGSPWPVFHSLQGVSIAHLASLGGGVIVAIDAGGRVRETLDNGFSWREIPTPGGSGRPTALGAWSTPANIVLATKGPGLFRRPIGAAVASTRPSLTGMPSALLRRARGGTAVLERPTVDTAGWVPLVSPIASSAGLPPVIRTLAFGRDAVGPWFAAVAGTGLYRSLDGGASWEACAGLPSEVYSIRTGPKGLVVAGTSDGVWISADGGVSWADKSGGLEKARQVRAVEIKPGNPNVMLAGAAPGGSGEGPIASRGGLRFALYETKDGGKTWVHVTRGFPELLESDPITDIRYNPADPDYAAISLASGEMWNTRADGLWWEPLARQVRGARVVCATS